MAEAGRSLFVTRTGSLDFNLEATWRLLVPDGPPPPDGWPLVIALHGMGMTAEQFSLVLNDLLLPKAAFLFPQGVYPYEIRKDGKIRVGYAWYVYDGTHKVVLFNKDHRLPSEIPALPHPNAWMIANLPREGVYISTPDAPSDREVSRGREELLRWGREQAARSLAGKIGGLWLSARGSGSNGSSGHQRQTLTIGRWGQSHLSKS